MKTNLLARFCLILAIAFLFHNVHQVKAAELIVNGGFESTTPLFQGWTVLTTGNGWYPWQVTTVNGGTTVGSIQLSAPPSGTRSAWTGFCCNTVSNPEYIQQDITIPAGQFAQLTWSDKIQSNMWEFCTAANCGSNTWKVEVLNTSNTVLQTLYTVTSTFSPTSTNLNTGWVNHTASLNVYAGQTVRLRFSGTYSSSLSGFFNGPGRAEVDNVSVQTSTPTAAGLSLGGRITNETGRGISRTSVSIINLTTLETHTTLTNPFGYYQFSDLPAGEFYNISVRHKRFQFAQSSRTLQLLESLSDVNFTGSPPSP